MQDKRQDQPRRATAKPLRPPSLDEFGESEAEIAEARRQQREDWPGYHARMIREMHETRRQLFTVFRIWTICPHKDCRRAQACRAVDTEECRRERWRHVVTDEIRFVVSRTSKLVREGHSPREAYGLARAEWDRKEKVWAEIEARHGAQRPAGAAETADDAALDQPAADTVPDDRAPRIRSL